ncbi:MAG: glycosyltransferase, partial [Bdellovibrionales bacterium]|nr:glycosyltransferase [Bdellovibrionales bacterium]
MNILMVTNTFLPHVGGVARSVAQFADEYRRQGHKVLVLAPEFDGATAEDTDVVRIPALQNFNGSDFSVRLPIPTSLFPTLQAFEPDIVHSHHPFLLGDTALRIAAERDVPLVFTHHTMYEEYTHYAPGDSAQLKEYVMRLATEYANLCNLVFAPSESIKEVLLARGVETPIQVIPTGVELAAFDRGDRERFRKRWSIPSGARVAGHVGRLAEEKNLRFLVEAVSSLLKEDASLWFVLVGDGPLREELERRLEENHLLSRSIVTGRLSGTDLTDAYRGMDVFLFSSYSETQGMVLIEAMAAHCPVIALDAPGAREVVRDGENGRLLATQDRATFVEAAKEVLCADEQRFERFSKAARTTADRYSSHNTASLALECYEKLLPGKPHSGAIEGSEWVATLRRIEAEWDLLAAHAQAIERAIVTSPLARTRTVRSLRVFLRKVRRLLSRGEWSVRLLGLSRFETEGSEPGLILIQIDGLARHHFNTALAGGKLPFLRRLLRREQYRVQSVYSGVPSTTPAAQAELFYGKRAAVPSFAFFQPDDSAETRMFDPTAARQLETVLASQTEPLLSEGSAYSNIYTGGAAEASFCSAAMGVHELLRAVSPRQLLGVVLWHGTTVLRCIVLVLVELVLAFGDCIRGALDGKNLWYEIAFVPARVAICILLREAITSGAIIDVHRGLPIIHLNYLGYDEQAHHRGPGSQFAYWTLKGIDGCIKRIWRAAARSPYRRYDIWVYSDHGQEANIPYEDLYGETVFQPVRRVFGDLRPAEKRAEHSSGVQLQRMTWLGADRLFRLFPRPRNPEGSLAGSIRISAMGPLAHVYCEKTLSEDEKSQVAQRLVADAHIPIVFYRTGSTTHAVTAAGRFRLPQDAAQV